MAPRDILSYKPYSHSTYHLPCLWLMVMAPSSSISHQRDPLIYLFMFFSKELKPKKYIAIHISLLCTSSFLGCLLPCVFFFFKFLLFLIRNLILSERINISRFFLFHWQPFNSFASLVSAMFSRLLGVRYFSTWREITSVANSRQYTQPSI